MIWCRDDIRRQILFIQTAGANQPAVFLFGAWKNSLNCVYRYESILAKTSGELEMKTLADLTSRELEILELVLAGYTNKAIAAKIFVSEKTVEFHLDNIYTKIGKRTRMMAGLWALQQGIDIATREISR